MKIFSKEIQNTMTWFVRPVTLEQTGWSKYLEGFSWASYYRWLPSSTRPSVLNPDAGDSFAQKHEKRWKPVPLTFFESHWDSSSSSSSSHTNYNHVHPLNSWNTSFIINQDNQTQSVFWLNFSTPPRHSAKPRRWASTPPWCNHHCLLNRHDHPTSSDSWPTKTPNLNYNHWCTWVVGRVEVVTGELWKQESMLMLLEFHTSSTWHHITLSESKWIFPVNCHAPARHNDRTWKHQASKFGQSHRRPRWKAAS